MHNFTYHFGLILIVLFNFSAWSQTETTRELPYSFTNQLKKKVPKAENFEVSDSAWAAFKKKNQIGGVYKKGMWKNVNYNAEHKGVWDTLNDGSKVWRMAITSKGAKGITLKFSDFYIPKGGAFYGYTADKSFVIGPVIEPNSFFDDKMNLYLSSIPSDFIILEYNQTAEVKDTPNLHIQTIWHRISDLPYGYLHQLPKELPIYQLYSKELKERRTKTAIKYANVAYETTQAPQYNTIKHGIWDTLKNGDRIWRLGVQVDFDYAKAITFDFYKPIIPEGAHISIYTQNKTIASYSRFTQKSTYSNSVGQKVAFSPKQVYIIEYYEPLSVIGQGKIELTYCRLKLTAKPIQIDR